MVECAGLENQYTYMGIEGSNPSLSASFFALNEAETVFCETAPFSDRAKCVRDFSAFLR